MSTVTLFCANCEQNFTKDRNEISRRKNKTSSTNFFCSRSCASIYGNRHRTTKRSPLTPRHGNQSARKYSSENSWYVSRAFKDQRKHVKCSMNRQEYDALLSSLWTGVCSITGVTIHRKLADGSCVTQNPFNVASVDRIDSSLPYQEGNVQWVSQAINYAKNDDNLFEHHFTQFIEQLISHRNS